MYINCDVPTEVSEEDFDYLNGLTFNLSERGYLQCGSKEHYLEYLHIIVAKRMGLDTTKLIDHKDRIKLNNQRYNLREATKSQNAANSKLSVLNTSGHKGVIFDKERQKWIAQIKVNYKNIFLGRFEDYEKACKIRDDAVVKYFGEFST